MARGKWCAGDRAAFPWAAGSRQRRPRAVPLRLIPGRRGHPRRRAAYLLDELAGFLTTIVIKIWLTSSRVLPSRTAGTICCQSASVML